MRALLTTEFAALLLRADVSQAAFARLSGVTPRQVKQLVPRLGRSASLGRPHRVLLDEHSPEALTIMLEEVLQTLADAEPAPPIVDTK